MSNRFAPAAAGHRRRRPQSRTGAVEPLEPRTLLTTAALLADLSTGPTAADLTPAAAVGDVLYAGRVSDGHGELWRTDGTSAGTVRVAVLATSAAPAAVTPFGDGVVYADGPQLFATDGTPGDARLLHTDADAVSDTDPDADSDYRVAVVGGRLWFATGDGLYVSDGTAAGTAATSLGTVDQVPTAATPDGTDYFLVAGGYSAGSTLYRSDGTAAGTTVVTQGYVTAVGVAGGRLVYETQPPAGSDADAGIGVGPLQLWAVSAAGTPTLLKAFANGYYTGQPGVTVGSDFDFTAADDGTGDTRSVWRTDGTAAGTVGVGPGFGSNVVLEDLAAAGDRLYFEATGSSAADVDLWSLAAADPSAVDLTTFTDQDSSSSPVYQTAPVTTPGGLAFTVVNYAYSAAAGGVLPQAVFRSDGTPAGTVRVAVAPADNAGDVGFGDVVPTADGQLWASESGTTADFQTVDTLIHAAAAGPADSAAAFSPAGTELSSTDPTDLVPGSPVSFFSVPPAASAPSLYPDALWRTDGTVAGSYPLPAVADGDTRQHELLAGDRLLYTVTDADGEGTGLYVSDGTAAGTGPLLPADAGVTVDAAEPYLIADGDGGAYFAASTSPGSLALWHTDGTTAGTAPVGAPLDYSLSGAAFDGRFYFASGVINSPDVPAVAADSVLSATDGTAAGTTPIFTPAVDDGDIADLTPFGGRLFFRTNLALYATDGTAAGTVKLADLSGGEGVAVAANAAAGGNGKLFFLRDGDQLWETDGTPAGTAEVFAGPVADPTDPSITGLTMVGGRAVFAATDAAHGTELWSSDGTPAGTGVLSDVDPGTASSDPEELTAAGGLVFFTADDGAHGRELWATDGTPLDTGIVADTAPGATSGDPHGLAATPGGQVLFAADDGVHGTELWETAAGTPAVGDGVPPTATLVPPAVVPGATAVTFAVTYADASGIDPATLSTPGEVTVAPSGGTPTAATVVATDAAAAGGNATSVTYRWAVPAGKLTAAANGSYAVTFDGGVADATGVPAVAGPLGTFAVDVPATGPSLATTAAVTGAAVGGGKGVAHVTVRNAGPAAADGTVTVQLLLSTTATADPGTTTPITSVPLAVRLKPGQSKATTVRFTYPAGTTDGTRYVVAAVDADGKLPQVDATAATAASAGLAYRHASVDLSATAAAATGRAGKRASVVLRVHNAGSVTAAGPVSFAVSLSGGSLTAAVTLPAVTHAVSVKAGATKAVPVPFTVPAGLAAGTYTVTVTLSPTTTPADADATDKTVAVTFTVV